MTVIWYHGPS